MKRREFLEGAAVAAICPAVFSGTREDLSSLKLETTVPVIADVDVLVVGGGPAGTTAALAASRAGRSVYLAEETGAFGGAATAAGVPCFCMFGDGVRLLSNGIELEIRKMVSKGDVREVSMRQV